VRTVTALLTNKAYGYPTRGARRRRKPTILACLHQTANAKANARQERNYANRTDSNGPSATVYIDRDGTIIRAIDPAKYAAWSQGDVASPSRKIPTIVAAVASGVNLNEWVYESVECSGAGAEPFTDAQFEAVAQLVAAAHRATGLPINRSTVVVHADINSVSRRSDPRAAVHPRGTGQAGDHAGERDREAASGEAAEREAGDHDRHRQGRRHPG
jgi:N-acetyl-anhydromuramyl-L-alanine amidase AmpD